MAEAILYGLLAGSIVIGPFVYLIYSAYSAIKSRKKYKYG